MALASDNAHPHPFLTPPAGFFTFRTPLPPHLAFTPVVDSPPASPPTRKRRRPLADLEGVGADTREYNKKRRLRLTLITSRLSAPFAVPPTNILDRGNCPRVALWAKTRCVARGELRKAAILNKIKRDAMAARAEQERRLEAARKQFRCVVVVVVTAAAAAAGGRVLIEYRERLAAAAHSSFQRNDEVRRVRRRRPPPPPARKGAAPAPGDEAKCSRVPDPYDSLPDFMRPPSPPSESELNRQRRGMGLDIGCY